MAGRQGPGPPWRALILLISTAACVPGAGTGSGSDASADRGGNGNGGGGTGVGGQFGASGGTGVGGGATASGGRVGQTGGRSGSSGGSGSGGGAGATDGAVTFVAVQAIFDSICTDCHLAGAVGLPGASPLVLTADASYAALVGKAAAETCGGTRVVPGDSANSYLFRKLTDAAPCSGLRMPRAAEGGQGAALSASAIGTISRWIDEGARR